MKMLTQDIIKRLPQIGDTSDKKAEDVKVIVKFFCPWNQWMWFATEGSAVMPDGEYKPIGTKGSVDIHFFGWVHGICPELGMFSLSELVSVSTNGVMIERDMYYGYDHTLAEVMADSRKSMLCQTL
jgi:hypothetical protein